MGVGSAGGGAFSTGGGAGSATAPVALATSLGAPLARLMAAVLARPSRPFPSAGAGRRFWTAARARPTFFAAGAVARPALPPTVPLPLRLRELLAVPIGGTRYWFG